MSDYADADGFDLDVPEGGVVILGVATADPPLYLALLGSSVIGALIAFVGVWLTQRETHKREDKKWQREVAAKIEVEHRQLLLDATSLIEIRRAWLRQVEFGPTMEDVKPPLSPDPRTELGLKAVSQT
jgi:hypothetical protein